MSRFVFGRVALMFVASSALACASGAGTGAATAAGAGGPTSPRRDRNQIMADEMTDVAASNLYEVIQHLHPEWFVVRNQGPTSRSMAAAGGVQVYIDSQHAGNTEVLKQLVVSSASSLKYYSASEAESRFGNGNTSGAIQVITARRP